MSKIIRFCMDVCNRRSEIVDEAVVQNVDSVKLNREEIK